MPPLGKASQCWFVTHPWHANTSVISKSFNRSIHVVDWDLSQEREKMKELKERERDACSNFLLASRVQASTKQLYISGNFTVTGTVAECDLVYASSMYDSKSFVAGCRCRASHTGMVEVNDKASLFESCPLEKRALPLL